MLALLVGLSAGRTAAAGNGEIVVTGKTDDIRFGNVYQWSDNRGCTVICEHARSHCLEGADKKLVEKQRLDKIVEMMTQSQLVAAELLRESVEGSSL